MENQGLLTVIHYKVEKNRIEILCGREAGSNRFTPQDRPRYFFRLLRIYLEAFLPKFSLHHVTRLGIEPRTY